MERVWEVFADAWNILLNELIMNDAVPVALAYVGTAVARAYDDCGCRHLNVLACLLPQPLGSVRQRQMKMKQRALLMCEPAKKLCRTMTMP